MDVSWQEERDLASQRGGGDLDGDLLYRYHVNLWAIHAYRGYPC